MKIKIRNKEFEITDKDIVLFNGVCWMLITQEILCGYHNFNPILSKVNCERWREKGALILIEEKDLYTTSGGEQMGLWYYKFDIEKMKELKGGANNE